MHSHRSSSSSQGLILKVRVNVVKFVGWYYRMHIKLVPFSVLSGPDLEGGGGRAFGLVPPRNNAKNILLSHILHKIKKKCVSLAQLLLPDVNKQSFGHDSCCYLNHLPGYYPSFLIYCIFSDLINWCPLPSCWAVPPPPPPPQDTKVWIQSWLSAQQWQ